MKNSFSRRNFINTTATIGTGVCTQSILLSENKPSSEFPNINPKKKVIKTGFHTDVKYLKHLIGKGHPESPERLKAIHQQLKISGTAKLTTPIKAKIDPLPYISQVHSDEHIQRVKHAALDESICSTAVSGVLSAVNKVCSGELTNAFCAIRPPGHHAANNGPYGFCFYNNIAIAAKYAQSKFKLKKILTVDWDYHHGDGTEWAFYDDPSVLCFSTHALYAFPFSGSPNRTGVGKGKGFNINVALPRKATDKDIITAFKNKLIPAADKFKPDLILISAGFDSRKDDRLGDFKITDTGFEELTKIVMELAHKHCDSKIVSMLEGGYNTQGLALAVDTHIKALLKG